MSAEGIGDPVWLDDSVLAACRRLGWERPRPAQMEVLESIYAGNNVVGVLPTSAGKCLGRGTPVLKFDGSVVPVEDVKVGDLLMGPDSRPRSVLSTTKGRGDLFRVIPQRGDSYVVNGDHVLSLRKTASRKNPKYPSQSGGAIVNISVRDWLSSSKWFRHVHKGWRTGVEFGSKSVHPDLPPYILGIWLGDGSCRDPSVTTADHEVVAELQRYADSVEMRLSVESKPGNAASTYSVRGVGGRWDHCGSRLTAALREMDLVYNKHIPFEYLASSTVDRMELLAGIIDSDGYVDPRRHGRSVEVTFVNERLANDLVFLLRSLGFHATLNSCEKTCVNNGFVGTYYRVYGSGDFSTVPVRIPRKKVSYSPPRTNPLNVGIRIEPAGQGDYFGFELDGDHLFLLGDFTVTHNSGIFQIPTLSRPGLTVVVSPLVALMMDQVERLRAHGVRAYALNSHCTAAQKRQAVSAIEDGDAEIVYLSPERMQGLDPSFFGRSTVQMFAIDEAHCISEWGHDFRPPYLRIGRFISWLSKEMPERPQIVALTATATAEVVAEICKVLQIDGSDGEPAADQIIRTPDRPNITYGVSGDRVSLVRLVEIAGRVVDNPLPCLVYGSTRKSVEAAAVELSRSGYRAEHYHAGLSKQRRFEVQERFIQGEIDVLTATCAFGMGIDHGGIRTVIHLEMPTSLEAYMQESGRAGRDGSPSIALCRATVDTLKIARSLTSMAWPTPKRVREFWHALSVHFEDRLGKWEGQDSLQKTDIEIGELIGFDPIEVGSCLRILHDEKFVRVIPWQDRPVEVILLEGAHRCSGRRQLDVLARLRRYANEEGRVKGSVAFFANVIGVGHAYLRELSARQALRVEWTPKCQIVQRLRKDAVAEFDYTRIRSVRGRSINRIHSAEKFLSLPRSVCRRDYLLRYFGDSSGGSSIGRCCDHCP